eukprot:362807_1
METIEMLNEKIDDQHKNMEEDTKSSDVITCLCGSIMTTTYASGSIMNCTVCGIAEQNSQWKCNGAKHCDDDWVICDDCLKMTREFGWDDVNVVYKTQRLYFIYDDQIKGPFIKDELITLYVKNKIKKNIFWVTEARGSGSMFDKKHNWYKVTLPDSITFQKDESPTTKIQTYIEANMQIKKTFPELYVNLIQDTLIRRIKKCAVKYPANIPQELEGSSIFSSVMQIIGKIIFISVVIILGCHCLATFLMMFVVVVITNKMNMDDGALKTYSYFVMLYVGMAVSPPLITKYLLLGYLSYWTELQSWMISYCVWGIISFITSTVYLVCLYYKSKYKIKAQTYDSIMQTLDALIFLILGVDTGDLDEEFSAIHFGILSLVLSIANSKSSYWVMKDMLFKMDSFAGLGRFYVFPALASLLPSAVCGFIANFILEEKFELKCGEALSADMSDQYDLCFDDERGCCNVISSHDIQFSYSFVGGLASNMLAVWAMIRFLGYLIVNASRSLSIHVKRKK